MVQEEIARKAGKDGIAIKCISAPFLKARVPIKSSFDTLVVANAPTEAEAKGANAK